VPRAGHHCEAGSRLNAAQDARPLVNIRIGGGIAPAPNPVEPGRDPRQRLGQRAGAGEPPAAHSGSRVVCLLQIERQFVDLGWVVDHQLVQVVPVSGEFLRFIGALRHPAQLGRRAGQPEAVRADHGKAAQSVTEFGRDAAADDAPERKSGQVRCGVLLQDDVEPSDNDRGEPGGGPRLRRRRRFAKSRQVRRDDPKSPRQWQHVADPMHP